MRWSSRVDHVRGIRAHGAASIPCIRIARDARSIRPDGIAGVVRPDGVVD
jgi:hypothetical protein